MLDASEVTATRYVCNGPPGTGITWVDVSGTAVQASSNTGYRANNSARVDITLPVNPAIGDVVEVAGVGTGGWKILQNVGQNSDARHPRWRRRYTWTAHESNRAWSDVASSADGTKLVAVAIGDQIYT